VAYLSLLTTCGLICTFTYNSGIYIYICIL